MIVEAEIPASLRPTVEAKLALAVQERVAERLAAADATLWGPPGTPEVANRLGWLDVAQRMLVEVRDLEAFADRVISDGLRDVVLLGMGGSSLAPEVLRRCFGEGDRGSRRQASSGGDGRPKLHVLDSTDAARILAVQGEVDPHQTLFLVSSKSGGTIEPLSLFAHFWSLVGEGTSFAAITDPGSGLQKLAEDHHFRRVFAGDPDIGGRYSALSPFGIVPAALLGVDVGALLGGAPRAWETPVDSDSAALPAGAWLGAALSALAQAGRNKLTFLIDPTLPGLGLWLEQLVAESTGKHGTGILPVADEPPGEDEAYGEDRVFMRITNLARETDAEQEHDRARAYVHAGHPLITVPTRGPADLGRVFLLAELAVAVAGWGLQINPFDQPNVQQAKDATNRVLAGYRENGALPRVADADERALAALLAEARPPSYVAIMGYVQPSGDFDAAVGALRTAIRAATAAATTFGYGPRFLHSTGQLHKGGPKTGRFLQLLHDGPTDVQIPGASYTFTTLKNAQAIGDLQTLRELGLPAERVRLEGDDPAVALRELTHTIKELLG
jgi:transaldolase / glucose-6-phosphate isomerase